ncbi:MAG: DUF6498-containing protein [Pseudomonadales bacterium]
MTNNATSFSLAITPWLLVVANLLPLLGVLFWDWDVASIVVFFWIENLVIGFYNLIKMLSYGSAKALFLSAFFTVHYGGFAAGHGLFISELFNLSETIGWQGQELAPATGLMSTMTEVLAQIVAATPPLWLWGCAALMISHGGSLLLNFFLRGGRAHTNPDDLMTAPYKRLVILHVTIIVGGIAIEALGSPLVLLVLFIFLKIVADLRAHLLEHDLSWRTAFSSKPSLPSAASS